MNTEWALRELDEFVRLTESRNGSGNGVTTLQSYAIHPRIDVLAQWVVVQSILDSVYPKWQEEHSPSKFYEFAHQRDAVIQARARLLRQEEIKENLAPVGPILSAEKLHPAIWGPASSLWRNNHIRSAVQVASTSLDAKLQDFGGRIDINGRDLANQMFSDEPPAPGKPRLRVPTQANMDTTKSLQQGMRSLGEACFSVIRNLATHQLGEMTEQEGLEQLAVLSLFTRLMETCDRIDV